MADVQYILSLKDLFTRSIENAKNATDKLDSSVNNAQNSLSGLAKKAAAAFSIYQLADFAKGVIEVGGNFEAAEIGLSTLLKSGDAAKQVFKNIKEDAAKTPFDVTSLLMGNKALISAGVSAKDARNDILNLANAVAATGGGNDELARMTMNMQQIKNIGKATALDIKQFAYAGINIYGILADATGKSTQEVKGMEVSYDLLTSALEKAGKAGGIYANGLENMAGSTNVQVSNLGDTVMFLKDDLFNYLKPAIDAVIQGLAGFISTVRDGISWMKENEAVVKSLALAIGILTAGIILNNGYVAIAAIRIGGLTIAQTVNFIATNGLAGAWMVLNTTIAANPIGLVIVALAAFSAGIYYAWQKSDTFRATLYGLWEVAKELLSVFVALGKAFVLPTPKNISGAISALQNMSLKDAYDKGAGLSRQEDYFNGKKKEDAARLVEAKDDAGFYATLGTKKGLGGVGSAATSQTSERADKVKSTTPKIFNISIGKLNEKIEINTTKFDQSASKVEEIMTKVFLSVVNDVNRIATN